MHNLYLQTQDNALTELQIKIKNKITNGKFKSQNERKSFNLNIKRYQNLCRYQHHRTTPDLRNRVNTWLSQNHSYLDTEKETFSNAFANNYGEKLCELAIADFSAKRFTLKKRLKDSSLPDLELEYNQKSYYLEITTRDSTILLDYLTNFLPHLDNYIEIAKIFFHKNELLKKERSGWRYEWWWRLPHIYQAVWKKLDSSEKDIIYAKLGIAFQEIQESHLEEFNKWIAHSQYILLYFKEILPENILEKFSTIKLSGLPSWNGNEDTVFQKILSRFTAQSILEKLEKHYFDDNRPIILAFSLSLINDPKMIHSAEELISGIYKFLPEELKKVSQEKQNLQFKIARLKKLYAILIDTSWYNWFPDIAGASMPSGYDNCYGIIYNTNLSEETQENSDKELFDGIIPYKHFLKLDIL